MQTINREMKVKAKNGKEYFLVEVIAHILKFLKDELIKKMKRADWALNATDFDWVITVPAIWRARGKQMMREAGYKVLIHYLANTLPIILNLM
jgi:molecular chaperone DnaK (HSP70)